jgi:hypothetical protein
LILALHHDARFIKSPDSVQRAELGFTRLIDSYRNPQSRSSLKTVAKTNSKSAAKKTA